MSAGDNDRRSKCFCSIAVTFRKFYVQIFNTHLIRLRVTEGPNMNDQIESCAFHSFLEEVQIKCLLPTCNVCIITTWRLGLQAPLVALFSISFGTYNRLQQQWQHVGAWWTTKRVLWYFFKKAYSSKLPTLSSFMATLKACSGRSADLQKYIKTLHSWTQHNVKTFWKWGRSVLEFNHPIYIEWDLAMSLLYEWKLYSKMGLSLEDRVAHLLIRV